MQLNETLKNDKENDIEVRSLRLMQKENQVWPCFDSERKENILIMPFTLFALSVSSEFDIKFSLTFRFFQFEIRLLHA